MSDIQLSKDADHLMCLIYKHYLELRDNGVSKAEAKKLDSVDNIHYLVPNWSLDDIHENCLELSRKKLLSEKKPYVHEKYSHFSISDEGIIYMENRFKNGLKELVDFITKLIP